MAKAREDPDFWSEYPTGARANDEMAEALASRLGEAERVAHRVRSSSGLVHELQSHEIERGGEMLCAVTDRKLVFVVEAGSGLETAAIPYTELTRIGTEKGLLQTELSVKVWAHGTLRFRPKRSDAHHEVVEFVSAAIDTWQTAVAALQDAKQYAAEYRTHVEAGEVDAATNTAESVRHHLDVAGEAAREAGPVVGPAIEERIASVEDELARGRLEAHFNRGRALAPRAYNLAVAGRYDAAIETVERARAHVDTALEFANERDSSDRDRIRSLRNYLDEEASVIESKPLERAESALAAAREAAGPHADLRAWEHALSCYRDALTAGWGTDAFDGDTDALRVQVEWLVAQVLRRRQHLAERYEADGDAFRAHGTPGLAVDRYETACAHLRAAARLADEFRAGDAEALRDRCWWVATKSDQF